MLDCPRCGGRVPEVHGAATQVCPACGHESSTPASPPEAEFHAENAVDPWTAVKAGLGAAARHYPKYLLFWLPMALLGTVVVLASATVPAPSPPAEGEAPDTAALVRYAGVLVPLALVEELMFIAFFGASAVLTARALEDGREVRTSEAFETLVKRLPRLLLLGLLVVAFVIGAAIPSLLVAALVANALGGGPEIAFLVALLVLGPVYLWLASRLLFAPAAAALSSRSAVASLRHGRDLAVAARTIGFALLVVLAWVALFFAARAVSGFALETMRFATGFAPTPEAVDVAALPFQWLAAPFVPAMVTAYYVLLVRPPPAPAGAASPVPRAARFRMTRCPACATVIPYETTESDTRVVCPSCGKAGVVRGG
ncbi:MAG TPA: hypothetical protein VM889_02240 [Candidatus Thermoplasmatota archaeon]|nr:hypothetical protein [Candidatus Thermoplasmatota archaeon]